MLVVRENKHFLHVCVPSAVSRQPGPPVVVCEHDLQSFYFHSHQRHQMCDEVLEQGGEIKF